MAERSALAALRQQAQRLRFSDRPRPNPRMQRTPSAPLMRQPLGAPRCSVLRAVVLVALGAVACASSHVNAGSKTVEAQRKARPVSFQYTKFQFVSQDPAPFWSLELMSDGQARMDARLAGLPEGRYRGVVAEELRSKIATELDRLKALPQTPICSGHFDSFQVVDLDRNLTSIECLPLRPGSELEKLFSLVEQALKVTEWKSSIPS